MVSDSDEFSQQTLGSSAGSVLSIGNDLGDKDITHLRVTPQMCRAIYVVNDKAYVCPRPEDKCNKHGHRASQGDSSRRAVPGVYGIDKGPRGAIKGLPLDKYLSPEEGAAFLTRQREANRQAATTRLGLAGRPPPVSTVTVPAGVGAEEAALLQQTADLQMRLAQMQRQPKGTAPPVLVGGAQDSVPPQPPDTATTARPSGPPISSPGNVLTPMAARTATQATGGLVIPSSQMRIGTSEAQQLLSLLPGQDGAAATASVATRPPVHPTGPTTNPMPLLLTAGTDGTPQLQGPKPVAKNTGGRSLPKLTAPTGTANPPDPSTTAPPPTTALLGVANQPGPPGGGVLLLRPPHQLLWGLLPRLQHLSPLQQVPFQEGELTSNPPPRPLNLPMGFVFRGCLQATAMQSRAPSSGTTPPSSGPGTTGNNRPPSTYPTSGPYLPANLGGGVAPPVSVPPVGGPSPPVKQWYAVARG